MKFWKAGLLLSLLLISVSCSTGDNTSGNDKKIINLQSKESKAIAIPIVGEEDVKNTTK